MPSEELAAAVSDALPLALFACEHRPVELLGQLGVAELFEDPRTGQSARKNTGGRLTANGAWVHCLPDERSPGQSRPRLTSLAATGLARTYVILSRMSSSPESTTALGASAANKFSQRPNEALIHLAMYLFGFVCRRKWGPGK